MSLLPTPRAGADRRRGRRSIEPRVTIRRDLDDTPAGTLPGV